MEIEDALWRAWADKFVEIVEAMDHKFRCEIDGNMHFFHRTEEGELLQIITWRKTDMMTAINLYGRSGSMHTVGNISISGEEIHVGGHGRYHRFQADAVPDLLDFVRRMRAKAMETAPAQS
ncbi:hypothetical protein O9X98_07025 [Agrobacterium salinitolerans]|nr:hypothetical protein [Agrobacterium salinitolerans]